MNQISFAKMQGCGNSFVIIRQEAQPLNTSSSDLSVRICSPNWGIGADGFFIVHPKNSSTNSFVVEMLNPDGSLMGMCGNGVRCVARYLLDCGLVEQDEEIVLKIESREVRCKADHTSRSIEVLMGAPSFEPDRVPLTFTGTAFINRSIKLPGVCEFSDVTAVSMGNPHCVIFLDSPVENFKEIGAHIEHHPMFPARTNVEFVTRPSEGVFNVSVWERGAGATLACGSGACAVVAAAIASGRAERGKAYSIKLAGGELSVTWLRVPDSILLSGPAETICSGVFLI